MDIDCLTTSTLGHSFRLFQYLSVQASTNVWYSSTRGATSQGYFPKVQLPICAISQA